MRSHTDLGKEAEELAVAFLQEKGFDILYRNWRYSRFEIDIVALKNGLPHFIEVKSRASAKYGYPEENVGKKKISFLLEAANEFLHRHPEYKNFQLDILSINKDQDGHIEYFFIEDVYL